MGQLVLSSVRKVFGDKEVVKGVDLEVRDREFVVLVGPSGCGKSTLLRMIAGLESIDGGEVAIDGRRVNDLPPVRRGIAMVFQSYALYPHMSVFENIAFPLRVERMEEGMLATKVHDAARVLQLEDYLKQRPGTLSGGQRQRVAIGRAIVREPKIFLFDEPLSNLDAALRSDMRVELRELHKKLRATMIYVTHDQVEAMTMADRIVVLSAGRIEQVGTPLELYHRPANLFVAGFIGNPKMNFIEVACKAVSEAGVTIAWGPAGEAEAIIPVEPRPGLEGKRLTLGIRPEHTLIGDGDLQLTFTPDLVEHLGIHSVAYGPVDRSKHAYCGLFPGTADLSEDVPMTIGFDRAHCHLFDETGVALTRAAALGEPVTAMPGTGAFQPSVSGSPGIVL
ncbi:ABC transporter ATP-binding protein [Consotaella aegiceratis]|uniref:ABC transporter ATP-binding protein n=1 Tax=Consotaella aegiceratis TaxID=3097961 RepID=UPI002F3E5BB8